MATNVRAGDVMGVRRGPVRLWATKARIGTEMRLQRTGTSGKGRKFAVKLWKWAGS